MLMGNVLNAAVWLLTLSTIVALSFEEFREEKGYRAHYRSVLRLVFGSLTGSLLLLTYYFVWPNFNIDYVFNRVSVSTPTIYRFSAVWAGQAGTFLIWSWAILGVAFLISETRGWEDSFTRRTQIVVLLVGLFFLSMAMVSSPFKPTIKGVEESALEGGSTLKQALEFLKERGLYEEGRGFVDGMGMSHMLMSPWMAMHPPIIFIGFALAVVPFAASFVYLFQQQGAWEDLSRHFARFSWLAITVAMTLGALWAYEELSYAGFWSWDPIESAAIIPWLLLTAFIHASIEYRRRSAFQVLAPLLGIFATILIIYATFISRSGVIKSAHAYAGSSVANYLIFSVVALSLLAIFLALRFWRNLGDDGGVRSELVSRSNAFYLSVLALVGVALVIAWGITRPVILKLLRGEEPPITPLYFNRVGYPFAAFLILLTGFCILLGVIEKISLLKLVAFTVFVSFVLFFLNLTNSYYFNTFGPIAIFAILCLVYKIFKDLGAKRWKTRLGLISKDLIHLGIVLVLLGAIVGGSFGRSSDVEFSFLNDVGRIKKIDGGYRVRLLSVNVFQDPSGNWIQEANLKIYRDTSPVGVVTPRLVYYQNQGQMPRVSILRGLSDVYAVFYGIGPHSPEGDIMLMTTIKTVPFVGLIWMGLILMSVGMFISLLLDLEVLKRIWE